MQIGGTEQERIESRSAASADPTPPPWRAIAIGLLLGLPAFYFGTYSYQISQTLEWSETALQLGGVIVLLCTLLLSLGLGLLSPRLRLQRSELLVVYAIATLTNAIGGVGMLMHLVPTLPAGQYYATPANGWEALFEHVPPWLTVNDATAVTGFYQAQQSLYEAGTLLAWAGPLAFWLPYILLHVLGTLALCNLVAREWVDHERLVFPLVKLPLEMTHTDAIGRFWTNRLMWAGFAVPAVLESFNFLNSLIPSVPTVWLKARPVGRWLTARPFVATRPLFVAFYPFVIGVGYLVSSETSLSCWLFYWLGRVQRVLCAALGAGGSETGHGINQLPLLHHQGTGALLTLMVMTLMIAWPNIRRSIRSNRPEGAQVLSSRVSVLLFAGCLLGLVSMSSMAGVPIIVAAVYFVLRWLFALGWGRVAAETGCGWTRQSRATIHEVVVDAVGSANIPRRGLSVMALFHAFNRYNDSRAPHILAALKLGDEVGISRAQLRQALFITIAVAILGCTWTHLHIFYSYGAAMAVTRQGATGRGRAAWYLLDAWFTSPQGPDWWSIGGGLFGAIVAVGLTMCRRSIPGFPLHPLGYAIANTLSMEYMWMPFLVAWLIKVTVLRYGGGPVYRRLVPLFLGLILGDFVTATAWAMYGFITEQRLYFFFPH